MDLGDTLHVAYGDMLAAKLPGLDVLIVREALREGPLSPDPAERLEEFVARRAGFLAKRYDAPELSVREDLKRAWQRLATHAGPIVLHVDEAPCIDCATFVACALSVMERGMHAGRAPAAVAVARGGVAGVPLAPSEIAAGVAAWRMLCAGDREGLGGAAARPEGLGGLPEFWSLLALRSKETRRFRRAAELEQQTGDHPPGSGRGSQVAEQHRVKAVETVPDADRLE